MDRTMALPKNDSAIDWVASALNRPLTDIEGELVTILCAATGRGPYDLGDWGKMGSGSLFAEKYLPIQSLSTFDFNELTKLVFAAHDRCCRVCISPAGPYGFKVIVHQRISRADLEDGEWAIPKTHPTIEEAVESWRART